METSLPALRASQYRFTLEAVDLLRLPRHQSSTLRGGFGYAFKKMVCQQKDWRACTPCQGGNDCPYGYIFETTLPPGSALLPTIKEIPIPFVIDAPSGGQTQYQPGDLLSFDLTLVGRAASYLPYFLLAFQELGRMGLGRDGGRYSLKRILAVHPWRETSEPIYDGVDMRAGGRDLSIDVSQAVERAAELPPRRLAVEFVTPTRLKHNGEITRQIEFHVLLRALLRRISALAYFHCGEHWQADFPALVAAAEKVTLCDGNLRWVDWERFSTRQQHDMNLGGMVGRAVYQGDLQPFLPLLALGEIVHVGKAAVFGHGRMQCSEP